MPPSGRRLLLGLCLLLAQAGAAAQPSDAHPGRSIYLDGRLASGRPLEATVQQGVALSGAAAACVNCHRRSGLGGGEGQSSIRPIAGRFLFERTPGEVAQRWGLRPDAARPAYTAASLARALRAGIDPAGRVLNPLMPRYALSDDEVGALQAYLQELLPAAVTGVGEREIHFATILAPAVDPDQRRALLDVLQSFFRDKNGGTRKEAGRRRAGTEQMYVAYRTWVLHVWELEGPPATWRDQLAAHARRQPVFAVIGGLGGGSWEPVHAFCEESRLPCVFPDVDDPAQQGDGFYSLYFSRGLRLEADVLARHLAGAGPVGPIVQVYRDDERGRVPAQALREALSRVGLRAPIDHPLAAGAPLSAASWSGLLHGSVAGVLVAWLGPEDLRALAAAGPPPPALRTAYLSASLSAAQDAALLPADWLARIRIVSLFEPQARRAQHLARLNAWLRARQVPVGDARTQANALFAATLAGDAIAQLSDHFSRDYFIERIEHMAGSALAPSIYPHLSLGPGQRFASRGGYILGFPGGPAGLPASVSDWIVP